MLNLVLYVQVYFVDDPYNLEWKVVRYKDPRSRRVTDALSEGSLSAPGRANATRSICNFPRHDDYLNELLPEPILHADVQHVMAHEEDDDEAAHFEVDHHDLSEDEPEQTPYEAQIPSVVVDEPIDDA